MSEQSPRQVVTGAESASSAEAIEDTFESAVVEGEERLTRRWLTLAATGAVGGIDVGIGVLALLLVDNATHNEVASSLAFGIGFLALTLANSELFTENFFVPIAALVAGRASVLGLARLWIGTLLTNLLGGWVIMAIVVLALPAVHPAAIGIGDRFASEGVSASSLASAILGGTIITLMTWMERGTSSVSAKIIAAFAAAFLLAAGHLDHAIVASLEMFAALQAGASFGYHTWLELLCWYSLGNIIGGIGLVTVLRLGQIGVVTIAREQERSRRGEDVGGSG